MPEPCCALPVVDDPARRSLRGRVRLNSGREEASGCAVTGGRAVVPCSVPCWAVLWAVLCLETVPDAPAGSGSGQSATASESSHRQPCSAVLSEQRCGGCGVPCTV